MESSIASRPRDAGSVLHLYRELWRHTHGDRHVLVGALALLVGAQLMLLALPWVSSHALNALQLHGAGGLRPAGLWLLAALGVTAGSWVLHGPGRVLERNVALRLRERLSTLLVDRALALPLAWHEANHSGATAHRIQQSTHALSGFAQTQFVYLSSAVRLVGPLVALFVIDPAIGAAAVAGFVAICTSVLGFDRAMIRLARVENDAERRYSATLVDSLGNATSVLALRQGRAVSRLLAARLLDVFAPLRRSIVLNELKWCTVDTCGRALTCALVALFAWRATSSSGEALLLGSVYMVWEYAAQAGGVISAVAAHFQTFARQHADFGSADAIRDAVPHATGAANGITPARRADGASPPHGAGAAAGAPAAPESATLKSALLWQRLDVRDLVFRHASARGAGAPTLDHLAFTLERGRRYALIGGSGSGKSTLLRALAGLYVCDRIVLSCDTRTTILSAADTADFLRATATLIPQDADVFEGTLRENLSLCEAVDGPAAAHAYGPALELACVTDFLAGGEHALDARVAERGANWSGGQRARVALARGALAAASSSLVLLDEPTASLDPATEARVYANLFAAFADACLVSSVHRLHLLSQFDAVLLMHEGRLVACGTPAEVAGCAEFAALQAAHRHESAVERPGSPRAA